MQHKNEPIILNTHSPEETGAIAQNIAATLKAGDVLLLKGDLGAGKSVFARALIQYFCGSETEVPSPTFTLVQSYETVDFILWHFDLYRLKYPEEVYELGIEEALQSGVSLIEWPERLGPYIPKRYIEIEIVYGTESNDRIISITKHI